MGFFDELKDEFINKLEHMADTPAAKASTPESASPPPASPPPIAQLQFFIAVDGKQTGPFNEQQIREQVQTGSLKKESMVWKTGMPAWIQAGQVTELSGIFNSAPPPLPPVPPIPA